MINEDFEDCNRSYLSDESFDMDLNDETECNVSMMNIMLRRSVRHKMMHGAMSEMDQNEIGKDKDKDKTWYYGSGVQTEVDDLITTNTNCVQDINHKQ